jgi:AbrB family looped-hinge helix DNA binding protein
MSLATVGARYQIVIPRAQREKLGLRPHAKVDVVVEGDHLIVRPVVQGSWRGLGEALSCNEDATDYVSRLRAEWGRSS